MPNLPLVSLPSAQELLIDANILVYGLNAVSPQCRALLARCAAQEISGFVTVDVLAEACHRLMVSEAAGRKFIARPNAANLQGKSHVIRQLTDYWDRLAEVRRANIAVLP